MFEGDPRGMTTEPLPETIFRTLVHFAPDAFLVVGEAGEIIFANAQAERMFGYQREELVGSPVDLLVPERLRGPHMDHRADYRLDPQPRPMGSRMPLVARRRDGSEVPVEVSLSPVYTDSGMYVTATVRDVTDRRAIEEALRASEERYRLLAENAEDVVYRIDVTTTPPRFEYVSPSIEALTGHSPAAFSERADLLVEITHPDDRALLEQWLRNPDETASPLILRAIRRDGSIVWHEQRFTVIRDDQGAVRAIEGIARDVTEQRRIEEERRLLLAESEIERERERIAADLHDGVMQTMYSVGLQLSSFLRRSPDLPEDPRANLEQAIEALNTAISDIRRHVMDLRPVDFTGDFDESLEALTRLFQTTAGVEVSLDLDRNLPRLDESVAVELFLLVREALSNVKRHAQASRVDIEAHVNGDHLDLLIRDDGIGFDPDSRQGTDHFGLRNMETRARILGGTLSLTSTPGQGTAVQFSIPVTRARHPASSPVSPPLS